MVVQSDSGIASAWSASSPPRGATADQPMDLAKRRDDLFSLDMPDNGLFNTYSSDFKVKLAGAVSAESVALVTVNSPQEFVTVGATDLEATQLSDSCQSSSPVRVKHNMLARWEQESSSFIQEKEQPHTLTVMVVKEALDDQEVLSKQNQCNSQQVPLNHHGNSNSRESYQNENQEKNQNKILEKNHSSNFVHQGNVQGSQAADQDQNQEPSAAQMACILEKNKDQKQETSTSLYHNDVDRSDTEALLADVKVGQNECTDSLLCADKTVQVTSPQQQLQTSSHLMQKTWQINGAFLAKESMEKVNNKAVYAINDGQSDADDERDQPLIIADNNAQVIEVENENTEIQTVSLDDLQEVSSLGSEVLVTNFVEEMPDDEEESLDQPPKSQSRSESQKKMEEGKNWLLSCLSVSTAASVIRLSDIEEAYFSFCKTNKKDPLTIPVLARLIHRCFPDAQKCRLGSRGQQRIHYRSLKFISRASEFIVKDSYENKNIQTEKQTCKNLRESGTDKRADSLIDKSIETQNPLKKTEDSAAQQTKFNQQQLTVNEPSSVKSAKQADLPHQQQKQSISNLSDEENCKTAAKKLAEVLKYLTGQGEAHNKAVLRDFAHSASCQEANCHPMCLMFRRVRRHVVAARHSCYVLRLYSVLLRRHVSSCTSVNCGLPACPALRATRSPKRQLEDFHQEPVKRAALPPRSPCGSLPDSAVNSPPSSPEPLVLNSPTRMPVSPGPVQYILLPVPVMSVIDRS